MGNVMARASKPATILFANPNHLTVPSFGQKPAGPVELKPSAAVLRPP